MRTEFSLQSFDHTRLYGIKDQVIDSKKIVIIVHGLCEHTGRYEHIAAGLNQAGYTTYRYNHRGHGTSEGKRTFFGSFTDISDDLNCVVDYVRKENPGLKLFLLGHSMGGHAVACFGTRFPGKVDGMILAGALTRQSNAAPGEFPIPLPEEHYFENGFEGAICSDPEVVEQYNKDPFVERRVSVGLLNRCWEGVQFLKENGQAFRDPVLVLHGCCDSIISEKDSREFFGDISSADKTLKIYAGLYHEILNEKCKDEILKEMITWLELHTVGE